MWRHRQWKRRADNNYTTKTQRSGDKKLFDALSTKKNYLLLEEITGCFKKTALIENRFKDTKYEAQLHWKRHFSYKLPSLLHGK